MTPSITRRLLIGNLAILCAFLALAGAALDRAFRSSVESGVREQLQAHIYTLLTAAEEGPEGRMRLPEAIAAPAFNRPDSGLYAEIVGEDRGYRWRSRSLIGRADRLVVPVGSGQTRFRQADGLALLDQGITWEDDRERPIAYTLTVAIDRQTIEAETDGFRGTLWRWLGGVAVVLLFGLLLSARWGLSPLRDISAAVQRIERGEAERIDGPVARELQGLSTNLNALILHNEKRQARVRNSLADLAHSMKTPLAVLRGAAQQQPDGTLRELIDTQTRRIDEIVSYQRQRASVAGSSAIARPIAIAPVVRRLCASLDKVYRDRRPDCAVQVADALTVRADQGDLFELLGNLLDNAYKHCRTQVRIAAQAGADALDIAVDDDGDGIPATEVERLLMRGERADQRHPGEGIGLAVVNEIVSQYGGRLQIRASELGGARILVSLPH